MISRKLLFNEFNFVITYRYAMNCRLRRQEKRDNLESQVRNMCLFCSVFWQYPSSNKNPTWDSNFFSQYFLWKKKQPDNYMAYLNLKNSLRERCEKSNNLFKKIDYIFVFLFFRYAMNCRLRRQENREKLESQVRFFYLPYIITLMHEKFGGKSLFRNFFSHISYM